MNNAAFLIFNATGVIVSISAVAVISHRAIRMTGLVRKGLLSFLKGFFIIGLSFAWTFFFGQLVKASDLLTLQSVFLSFGMAMLIYSANKTFDIYQGSKK